MKKYSFLQRSRKGAVIALFIILVTVGFVVWIKHQGNDPGKEQQLSDAVGEEAPSESREEADNYVWRGSADEPKKIVIEKIGVNSFVQSVGVDRNGNVGAPSNIYLAGWFSAGAKPGSPGLSVIDGHVTWGRKDAVFKNLNLLRTGDEFTVVFGDASQKRFRVFGITQLKAKEATAALFSQNPKVRSQLNLVTCGGAYNGRTYQYDERVIVSAELL